jgi:hypothetical protein
MPSNYCRICGRHLTNPLSIKLGIGPICRGGEYSEQGVLDFMHAQVELVTHKKGQYIFVRDIGHMTGRSVTNDAEYIVGQLYLDFGLADNERIFYEDSEGEIDELKHNGQRFTGYKFGHEGVEL